MFKFNYLLKFKWKKIEDESEKYISNHIQYTIHVLYLISTENIDIAGVHDVQQRILYI